MGFLPDNAVEVRGCGFGSSVYREAYFQEKINRLLSQHKLAGANEPLGAWEYADSTYKGVKICCGVFKTVGDLRLGTNLL